MTEELYYNEDTLEKIYKVLEQEVSRQTAIDLVNQMLNKGLLFRERTKPTQMHKFKDDLYKGNEVCVCGQPWDVPVHRGTSLQVVKEEVHGS